MRAFKSKLASPTAEQSRQLSWWGYRESKDSDGTPIAAVFRKPVPAFADADEMRACLIRNNTR